jgi:hypothetical protein
MENKSIKHSSSKSSKTPARLNEGAYYPTKNTLADMVKLFQAPVTRRAIRPGFLARTDGFDVDQTVKNLENTPGQEGLLSRLLSVSDLSEKVYDRFAENANSLYNWYPAVEKALAKSNTELKNPDTKVMRLPIELAQFILLEYPDTSQADKDLFNQFIFDQFGLEDDKTYFIKTGTFSSKFQFANAKCSEPREMGEYFQVVNNFAMMFGAAHTVDLVVREYIEDVKDNPTIYNGMPLRTEFRVFVDCDNDELIGVVPYWHPIVMKRAFKHGLAESIQEDYQTYLGHEQHLVDSYNENLNRVRTEIKAILPNLDLSGKYSIDVMKNGNDLYVIDLALMSQSALTELL